VQERLGLVFVNIHLERSPECRGLSLAQF